MKNNKTNLSPKGDRLTEDAKVLHLAVSELVRVYQFRDRNSVRYYDVTATQCYALAALLTGGPLTLNRLATALRLDKSTTSRMVDTLEEKKYVRRATDPVDGRALRLEITARGKKLHYRIQQDLIDEMKDLLTTIDPQVRQAASHLVTRLAQAAAQRFAPDPQA